MGHSYHETRFYLTPLASEVIIPNCMFLMELTYAVCVVQDNFLQLTVKIYYNNIFS